MIAVTANIVKPKKQRREDTKAGNTLFSSLPAFRHVASRESSSSGSGTTDRRYWKDRQQQVNVRVETLMEHYRVARCDFWRRQLQRDHHPDLLHRNYSAKF